MNITCDNCVQVLDKYLCDIPSVWRKSIVRAICLFLPENETPTCEQVKTCETITSLSAFTTNGTIISVTFKDEKHKSHVLTIDIGNALTQSLSGLNPMCLATQEEWESWTNEQRWNRIINSSCNCT